MGTEIPVDEREDMNAFVALWLSEAVGKVGIEGLCLATIKTVHFGFIHKGMV